MGKKKSHKRHSAVGRDEQGSLLVSVKSLVAARGAQHLCLHIKEETISLDEVLGDFRLSSGKNFFLTPHLPIYATSCNEARSYLPLPYKT